VAKRRALVDASKDKDFVVRDILLRGEGDRKQWTIAQASAETSYGRAGVSGTLATTAPFALDANAEAQGKVGERPYQGTMRLKGTLKAIDAALDAQLSGQRATARAALEPFSTPPVRSLEVHAHDVDISKFASAPPTRLGIEARLAAEGQAFSGPVRIQNADPGPWDQKRLPFQAAAARVTVTPERVDLAGLSVTLAGGGSASGRASLQRSGMDADLRVADVDLHALHHGLQKTRMTGRVAVAGTSAAQRFDLALKDPRFEISGRAGLGGERLEVETVHVQTGGGAIDAKGGMALAGTKEFRFEGEAHHFDPAAFVRTTAGDLNFRFVTHGTLAGSPAGELSADITPSRYAGLATSGHIRVSGDASRIASSDVHLVLGEGRLDASGSFGRPGDALDLTLHAPNLAVFAAPLGVSVAGRLDAQARLSGTAKAPAGRVTLTGANLVLPSNVFVRELSLQADAGSQPDSPIDATLKARGVAMGKDNPPRPLAENAALTLRGTRLAHRAELDADVTKQSNVKLAVQGGLDAHGAMAWAGRIESLALTGPGAFTLEAPATLQASAARVELGAAALRGEWGEANLALTRWTPRTLDLKGSSQAIQIQNLARSLKLGDVPRSSLVVAADWNVHAAQTFEGTVNLRRVSGDLRLGEPPLALGLSDLQLRLDADQGRAHAVVRIAGDRVGRVEGEGHAAIEHAETGWQLARAQPIDARFNAEVPDLSAFTAWLGPDAKVAGSMKANIVVSGTGADPSVNGEARAQNVALREAQSGFEMEQGEVALRLAGKSITVEKLEASTPWRPAAGAVRKLDGMTRPSAGRITADGSIDLGARTGNLRIHARQAVVTQTPARFLAISGDAQLQSTREGLVANGTFTSDAGWIGALSSSMPAVSEDVVVVRKSAPPPPATTAEKDAQRMLLDVRFDLGNHLYFEGRGLDTRLAGNLHVTGPPTALKAEGSIRTVGGNYDGYGQKLSIERGAIAFNGPIDNPHLNVRAVRKGLPVEAGVEVTGTVVYPKVRLVSSPDVPDAEKLSWMVLGRGPSELGPGDASVLVSAAASMLGKGTGAGFTEKLGLDEVKIGRADAQSVLGVLPQSTVAGRTGTASAAEVVSVGKRLTRNVHLTFEQGLSDAEGALKVTVDLSRQFQVLVRAGYLPGLDLVYRWTFD
jgi:Uncharacterized protein conserved in bacteria